MKRSSVILLLTVSALAVAFAAARLAASRQRGSEAPLHSADAVRRALDTTFLPAENHREIAAFALVDQNGRRFGAARLRDHWSLVFFGYTSCTDVCPMTLAALSTFARSPASGVESDTSQVIFVSVDPTRDTPARLKEYLRHFHPKLIALSGRRAEVNRLSLQLGAGYGALGAKSGREEIGHSTSVFLVDPKTRIAGVMLRATDPKRLLADFQQARESYPDRELRNALLAPATNRP